MLAAKIKIRLLIFTDGLQFASYGVFVEFKIIIFQLAEPKHYHCLLEALSDSSEGFWFDSDLFAPLHVHTMQNQ